MTRYPVVSRESVERIYRLSPVPVFDVSITSFRKHYQEVILTLRRANHFNGMCLKIDGWQCLETGLPPQFIIVRKEIPYYMKARVALHEIKHARDMRDAPRKWRLMADWEAEFRAEHFAMDQCMQLGLMKSAGFCLKWAMNWSVCPKEDVESRVYREAGFRLLKDAIFRKHTKKLLAWRQSSCTLDTIDSTVSRLRRERSIPSVSC